MGSYYDPVEEAQEVWQQRQLRRLRTESALRGWLREHSAPRRCALLFLAMGSLPGFYLALLLHRQTGSLLVSVFAGVFVLGVIFLACFRWRATTEFGRIDFRATGRDRFIFSDERLQQFGTNPLTAEQQEAVTRGIRAGLEQSRQTGLGGVLVLLLLGSMTLGLWIIWELTQMGADLLAQSILDGTAAAQSRTLARQINLEGWHRRVIGMTLLHFITLAASIVIFLGTCRSLGLVREESQRMRADQAVRQLK